MFMLADNMKAYEYFKYLIEVKKDDPLKAFEEVLGFIETNSSKIQQAIEDTREEGKKLAATAVIDNLLNLVEYIYEAADVIAEENDLYSEEECDCPVCSGEMTQDEYEDYLDSQKDSIVKQLREKYGKDIEIRFITEDELEGYDDEY